MVPILAQAGHEVCATWRTNQPKPKPTGSSVQLDIVDQDAVDQLFSIFRPDCVIHLAASNRSSSEEMMVDSIVKGASNLVESAAAVGARFIHMSTDVVFDGFSGPYTEGSPVSPIHAYGRAKARSCAFVLPRASSQ